MKTLFASIAVLGLALGTAAPTTLAAGKQALRVYPFEGHSGNTIYVSGKGFSPHQAFGLTITCGHSAYSNTAVRADARGQIIAQHLAAPRNIGPHALHCRIGSTAGGATAPYTILAPRKPLSHCAVSMCIQAQAAIVRLRNGTIGQIIVHGWAGARAKITVVHANGKRISRATTLDWRGNGAVRMRVSLGLKKAVTYYVAVDAWLGPIKGHTTTRFIVIPGGR